MSIGKTRAYPRIERRADGDYGVQEYTGHYGMTYRQWLIGQALAGECASNFHNAEQQRVDAGLVAEIAITMADAVIARLDAEAGR